MKKNLTTSAGHSTNALNDENLSLALTIVEVFALFEVNYHNQYHAALKDETKEKALKRLWMSSLEHFSKEIILKAAQRITSTSSFFPTIHLMIETCQDIAIGEHCPDEMTAYEEACAAPHPKNEYQWSHPAVYFAGARTGWDRIETQAESITLPLFKKRFKQVKAEMVQGQPFEIPKAITQNNEVKEPPVAKEDMDPYLESIKKILEQ